ncbi:hypothetical protein MJO28_006272 [Puccinia striiformis f. sp. tritici]|uniref:Uncharacterized protein n=1 Tax=Puccinia striiformis f. sp. tritici TaxID=168172 RepID=A0ACC0EGZ7_9BASI|nr:hypothetical protein MJO28_006272 [Puccinia striiformis f. sp. tritici]
MAKAKRIKQAASSQTQQSRRSTGTSGTQESQETVQIPWSPTQSQARPMGSITSTHAIELYVKAVEAGKRGDGGFKPEVHPHVASKLLKEFPGNPFDSTKVKSKYTQGFKKTCNAFVACKGASGFG